MGQVLHGSATTTEAVRRAVQHSEESLRALSKRYEINQKTVAKWKGRTSVADVPTGPKDAWSMARIRSVALNVLRANSVQNISLALYANAVSFDQLLALGTA